MMELTCAYMEKHHKFWTLLGKIENMQGTQYIGPNCSIISAKIWNKVFRSNLRKTISFFMYLSSNLVVAAEFTIMSISLNISSFSSEFIPKLSQSISPTTGKTLSSIKPCRLVPNFSLRTPNRSVFITCT